MIVRVAHPDSYPWIAQRACLSIGSAFRALEAVEDLRGAEGPPRLLAMVGFDSWCPSSVNLHVAVESPIALRRLITHTFGMVFGQFRLAVAIVTVKSTNTASLRLCRKIGFRKVFIGRDYFDRGVDMHVMEMRPEFCRWLGNPGAAVSDNDRRAA